MQEFLVLKLVTFSVIASQSGINWTILYIYYNAPNIFGIEVQN